MENRKPLQVGRHQALYPPVAQLVMSSCLISCWSQVQILPGGPLSHSVTVAQLVLVQLAQVRILVGQPFRIYERAGTQHIIIMAINKDAKIKYQLHKRYSGSPPEPLLCIWYLEDSKTNSAGTRHAQCRYSKDYTKT